MQKTTGIFISVLLTVCIFFTSCSKKDKEDETTSYINTTQNIITEQDYITEYIPVTSVPPETIPVPTTLPPATNAPEITESLPPVDLNPTQEEEVSPEMMDRINEIYRNTSIKPQTVTSVQTLAALTSKSYTIKGAGPISVTPAELNGEDITLVTLGGTQFVDGQATTIEESTLASNGKSNDYLKALIKLIENGTVPANKPMLVTGISLGGMIAQQILGEQELLQSKNIKIKAVITFGSPLTRPTERYGVKVVRFADVHDMVPKMGEMPLWNDIRKDGFINLNKKLNELNENEKLAEKSKYTNPIETHALSYIEDECWDKYDFLGSTKKENVLKLKAEMKFYAAPKLS